MTRMTGPDCVVMCNLINTYIHTYIHTYVHTYIHTVCTVITYNTEFVDEIKDQRASVAEEAREFTEAILGAAHAVLPEARRIPRRLEWGKWPAVRAELLATLDKKQEARRQCKAKHTTATWKALRAACKEVRAAIDKYIEIHLEKYVAELETLLRHRDMRGLTNA